MKKAILSVGIFLIGISTQANVTTESKVYNPWGNYERYLSTQSVTFYEDGILFEVFLDGSFSYVLPNAVQYNRRGRVIGRRNARRNLPVHANGHRGRGHYRMNMDRFGVIHSIGRTHIFYKPNGKVRFIGDVPLRYRRGRLVGVGGMDIIYSRRGNVSHTLGHINRLNVIYGTCGVAGSTTFTFADRYFGNGHYDTTYRVGNRSRGQTNNDDWEFDWDDDDWDDDWDDDDNDNRRGRRSRN
ncbi:hypothetical protein BTO09_13020 [Gilvibacter sp. SZ-19]|uniref:hypothetical protein n=1 Tax=Gilvibacter sp. SZ-19 TaxID=754429 RepID=UPI000B3BFF93|nr:hypothetical protein [Gilvibacter sp. SZ-19]ARV13206.1 hypothetical protein BTO09_13020 [Gilvibacter sp. SZ-19]